MARVARPTAVPAGRVTYAADGKRVSRLQILVQSLPVLSWNPYTWRVVLRLIFAEGVVFAGLCSCWNLARFFKRVASDSPPNWRSLAMQPD